VLVFRPLCGCLGAEPDSGNRERGEVELFTIVFNARRKHVCVRR